MLARRVAIVGYGTAGQALAVLLGRAGVQVEVFEQATQPGPVGAGFLLQPSGLQVLWQMGLLPEVLSHGARIERLYGTNAAGRGVMDIRYAALDSRLAGIGMQRGALFELLDRAWQPRGQLHTGCRIVSIAPCLRRLTDAAGHGHGPYDLIIAADGAASLLRGQVGDVQRDQRYPWGALWCLVDAQGWEHGNELRQRYVAARKMIGLLPVGSRPGDPTPRLSFFWSLPCDGLPAWQAQGMQAWHQELRSMWPECALQMQAVQDPAQLARAHYRDAVVQQWSRGRLVLAGDAAHAMSPQLGQGVNMALLDAWLLAGQLQQATDLDQALAAYARQRRAHVRIYQFWSRWLTPMFQSHHDRIATARDALLGPLGRIPPGKGHMLRVLTGTQHGILGKLALEEDFIQMLDAGGRSG